MERDSLVLEYLDYAQGIGANMAMKAGRYEEIEDYKQVAAEGLLEAAASWNPEGGAAFKTWLVRICHGRVVDYMRREVQDNGGRGSGRRGNGISFYATRSNDDTAELNLPCQEMGFLEFEETLHETSVLRDLDFFLVEVLTEREWNMYSDWRDHGSQAKSAEMNGVTPSRVCQVVRLVLETAKEFGAILSQREAYELTAPRRRSHGSGAW